jgi:hypothetical protein
MSIQEKMHLYICSTFAFHTRLARVRKCLGTEPNTLISTVYLPFEVHLLNNKMAHSLDNTGYFGSLEAPNSTEFVKIH